MSHLRGLLSVLFVAVLEGSASAAIRYVNVNATGANTGVDWANAFREIQPAIYDCAAGDEIWIATGIYYPDYSVSTGTHTGSRAQRIVLKSDISIFGGFAANETTRAQRDPFARRTIISGDIGVPGVFSDNTQTLLATPTRDRGTGGYPSGAPVTGVLVEGIVFAGGNANDPRELGNGIVGGSGGAVYIGSGSAEFRYCTFVGNYATYGGAMAIEGAPVDSGLTLVNCLFAGNSAQYVGGAIEFQSNVGQFTVRNCTLVNNSSSRGAAIGTNNNSGCNYFNNLIFGNSGDVGSRKVETGNQSSIAENNVLEEALVPAGPHNLVIANAAFAETPAPGSDGRWGTLDDVLTARLLPASPAHDFATTNHLALDMTDLDGDGNATETAPFDLLRTARVQNGAPDAGAFEINDAATLPPTLTQPSASSLLGVVSIAFTLPESALAGSVALSFNDGATSRILTLNSAQETQGAHSFSFNPANPLAATTAITAGSAIPDGAYSVTLSYRDAAGHAAASSAAQANVTIDTRPPTIVIPSSEPVVEATGPSGALVSFAISASDPHGPLTTTVAPPSGSPFALGSTTVNVASTDAAGNRATAAFTVKVRDTTAPSVVGPALQRLIAGPTGEAALPDFRAALLAADIVGVTTREQSPLPGTVLALGTHTVSFTVGDAAGNTATTATTVTVVFERATTVVSPIAVPGESVPGAGLPGSLPAGAVFGQLFTPAISDFRQITMRATLLAGRARLGAIYREDGAGVGSVLAFEGMPAPGFDGAMFTSFSDPLIAPGSGVAFAARVKGGSTTLLSNFGIWTTAFGGTLKLALREGGAVPGLPGDAVLRVVDSVSVRDGEMVALVTLRGTTSGRTDKALVRLTGPATGSLLLREGQWLAPTGSFALPVTSIFTLAPIAGSSGQGRWHADGSIVAKVTLAGVREAIVFISKSGAVTTLLAENEFATVIDPGARWANFSAPALSTNGTFVAVAGTLRVGPGGVTQRNRSVVIRLGKGAPGVVAREGDPAPGLSDTSFSRFLDPLVNGSGKVAFLAHTQTLGRECGNSLGLWRASSTALTAVALPGRAAPDADGIPSTAVWAKILSFALPDGLDGPVFVAELSGPGVDERSNFGLWAVDSHGLLRRLLRTGDKSHAGGITRTVADFTLLTALPPGLGATRSFNATGSLSLLATFTDHTQAAMRIDVP